MTEQAAHVVDTCVFVACGRPENPKFRQLRTEARKRGGTFLIPPRVYEELGGGSETQPYRTGSMPIESAIQQGWVVVTDPPDYANSAVSQVMDATRRFIATETGRDEDTVEKADTSLVGLAVQLLDEGRVERVCMYTGDQPAGRAAEQLIPQYGFDPDQIEWVDGHTFVENLQPDF